MNSSDSPQNMDRDTWLNEVCTNFVSPSDAHRQYYRLILEALWPHNHSIPGPVVPIKRIREIIDAYRKLADPNAENYKDPARRIRELQGEEGIIGLQKISNSIGTRYQLIHLNLEPKRDPRCRLPNEIWEKILIKYDCRCANCGRHEIEIRLDQDHKIPRLRGGGDNEENWQPLCKECNNFKSVSCRGCKLNCQYCPWAFPETYSQVRMDEKNISRVRTLSIIKNVSPSFILNTIIEEYFSQNPF